MIFGLSLTDYAIHHNGRSPPLIVTRCIDAVERLGGVQREGIYRVSGRQSAIDKLRQCFERDEEALEFGKSDVPEDVLAIASILKIYLRELSEPVFKFKLSDRLSYSSKLTHPLFSVCVWLCMLMLLLLQEFPIRSFVL
jgi:hypothetical protein